MNQGLKCTARKSTGGVSRHQPSVRLVHLRIITDMTDSDGDREVELSEGMLRHNAFWRRPRSRMVSNQRLQRVQGHNTHGQSAQGQMAGGQNAQVLEPMPQALQRENLLGQIEQDQNRQGLNLQGQTGQGQNIRGLNAQGQNGRAQNRQGLNVQGQNGQGQMAGGQNARVLEPMPQRENLLGQIEQDQNGQGQNIQGLNAQGQNIQGLNVQGQNGQGQIGQGQCLQVENLPGQNGQGQNLPNPNVAGQIGLDRHYPERDLLSLNLSGQNGPGQNLPGPNVQGQNASGQNAVQNIPKDLKFKNEWQRTRPQNSGARVVMQRLGWNTVEVYGGREAFSMEYNFMDIHQAWEFMCLVMVRLRRMTNHPDWRHVNNKVTVTLPSPFADGLSNQDSDLATFMDNIYHDIMH